MRTLSTWMIFLGGLFTAPAWAGFYDIDRFLPAVPMTGNAVEAVVIFSCLRAGENPDGEVSYTERGGTTVNLVVATDGSGPCGSPPPYIPTQLPLGSFSEAGTYAVNLYFVSIDTTFPVDLDDYAVIDTASLVVGEPVNVVVPALSPAGLIILPGVILVMALPAFRRYDA